MTDANTYPFFIVGDIMHAIRKGLAQFLILKVVHFYFRWLSLWIPFLAFILEIPYQFLLFAINGDDRGSGFQKIFCQVVEIVPEGIWG